MFCYYHEGRPAVGCCRSCLKGVCRDCAVDMDRGLACRDRCETDVRELLATIHQSVQTRAASGGILKASKSMWGGLAAVALLVGAGVGAWGLTLPVFREISLLGIPFLVIGLLTLRVARDVRKADAT